MCSGSHSQAELLHSRRYCVVSPFWASPSTFVHPAPLLRGFAHMSLWCEMLTPHFSSSALHLSLAQHLFLLRADVLLFLVWIIAQLCLSFPWDCKLHGGCLSLGVLCLGPRCKLCVCVPAADGRMAPSRVWRQRYFPSPR